MRLSKRSKAVGVLVVSLLLMAATVPLAIWVTNTQSAKQGNARARCESGFPVVHTVVVSHEQVSPTVTHAKQCEQLSIINQDATLRVMAFGPHDHHISYDGVSERVLGQGQSLTVNLLQTGTFTFHDHDDDHIQGSFTVSKS